jgi:chromosome segregation protein
MRLKRLELFGFKSFADRTVFEFGRNDVTGVVGPNGCGKSNVVDSVRWVLGETRPTSMRGAEMTDVIFKGCQSRPGMSVAEVSLILDNAASTLEGRGAEVSITRRVFRSGDGEYLIDGEKVRLKDIREMLFDTGLGSRGYSVLEQGKIDAVLSANPLERRRIFEEAAGISRYRQRRVEAELRLKKVAEDMQRLDDVVNELDSRVRSLKIQAGKAERFVEARDEWSRMRTRWISHRSHVLREQLDQLTRSLAAMEQAIGELRGLREGAESDVSSRDAERGVLLAEIERLVSEAGALAAEGRALDERRAQFANRAAQERQAGRDEAGRAQRLGATHASRAAEWSDLRTEETRVEVEAREAAVVAEELFRELSALESAWREWKEKVRHQNEAVLGLLDQRTRAENRARSLAEALPVTEERRQRAAARASEAQAAAQRMREELVQAQERSVAAGNELAEKDAARKALAQRLAEVATSIGESDREKNRLELEKTRLASRIEFLLDRERDLEDIGKSARKLMEGVSRQGEPCSKEELLGLVADHLLTDTVHARALDAVLGLRGAALMAQNRAAAQKIAAWLRTRESGQLSLLMPAGAAPAPLERELPPVGLHQGRLLEHVRCSAECRPLASILTGDVLLVADLEQAFALVGAHPEWRAVTPEGEVVDAAGILAGVRNLTQGAVGRRSSAAELKAGVAALESQLAAVEARRNGLVQERLALQRDWERSSQELEARRTQRAQAESQLATTRARMSDLEAAERSQANEAAQIEREIERLQAELSTSRAKEESTRLAWDEEHARLLAMEAERAASEEARSATATRSSDAQVRAARARSEHEGLCRRVRDLARGVEELELERSRAARLSVEHESAAAELESQCSQLAEQSKLLLEQRSRAEEQLGGLRTRADESGTIVLSLRERVDAVTRELEKRSERLSAARLEEQRLCLELAEITRRAEEELGATLAVLAEGFTPEPELLEAGRLEQLETEVRELRAKLDKIGPVNMEAMSELSEVGTRAEFLKAQRADLAAARASLDETVRTIDGESKRLFEETFKEVAENFTRIFRQLFGGGRAEVKLEEGVDILEAGVDIIARPPGREMLSIGLLSGGQRTMTALALLFAVFEARPSPFCILDEVDAALDDANIDRFLAMLAGYAQSTQFVVVTHNKGTMAACQALYGVTMETKGVSRQVSVELSEVERFVDAPAGRRTKSRTAVDAESGEPVVEIVAKPPPQAAPEPMRSEPPTVIPEEPTVG